MLDAFLTEWAAAERNGDTAKLDDLLSDDCVGIGPLGFSLPNPAWIARYHQGLHYDTFAVEDPHTRIYGEVAVVTGRHTQHGTFAANPIPKWRKPTHVLVRGSDRWSLAALHVSFVAGTPKRPPSQGCRPGTPEPRALSTCQQTSHPSCGRRP